MYDTCIYNYTNIYVGRIRSIAIFVLMLLWFAHTIIFTLVLAIFLIVSEMVEIGVLA